MTLLSSGDSLREAMAQWLERTPWTHFVTVTFRLPRTSPSAVRAFRKLLAESPSLTTSKAVFWGTEWHKDYPSTHVHALTVSPSAKGKERSLQEASWCSLGLARFSPYDHKLGARYYVAKYVLSDENVDWGIWTPENWRRDGYRDDEVYTPGVRVHGSERVERQWPETQAQVEDRLDAEVLLDQAAEVLWQEEVQRKTAGGAAGIRRA